MKLQTEPYKTSLEMLPAEGQYIIGQEQGDQMVVYQAFKPATARFAVEHQFFGGETYSYNRMSWIKPNFLWMMYRCGWCSKEGQERVLAIWIDKGDFEAILSQAVISTFKAQYHKSEDEWKDEMNQKDARLQWDPDHDPYGNKLQRRAIQIGMKGESLEKFGKKNIRLIEDITDFVKEQKQMVDKKELDKLIVPRERIITLNRPDLNIGLTETKKQ